MSVELGNLARQVVVTSILAGPIGMTGARLSRVREELDMKMYSVEDLNTMFSGDAEQVAKNCREAGWDMIASFVEDITKKLAEDEVSSLAKLADDWMIDYEEKLRLYRRDILSTDIS